MDTKTETTQNYEGELDINNQLGDQQTLAQLLWRIKSQGRGDRTTKKYKHNKQHQRYNTRVDRD